MVGRPYQTAQEIDGAEVRPDYCDQSLPDLARLVVEESDSRALDEIHKNRRVFRTDNGARMLLSEYLDLSRKKAGRFNGNDSRALSIADRAYDLTLDRFIHLPTDSGRPGPDCRNTFKAYIERIQKAFAHKPAGNQLEEEARAGLLLKGLVDRHFRLSLLEAERESNPFWSRYQWRLDNLSVTLWLPKTMNGSERREWLEKNTPDPNLSRPGERQRIQNLIDRSFVKEQLISLEGCGYRQLKTKAAETSAGNEYWAGFLARHVAREKAEKIHLQRSAIKALGPENVTRLILRIFEDVCAEEYEQKRIATEFNLSPATLSRFAGTDWNRDNPKESVVPDLWRNTAQVIAHFPVFREVAEETGMLERVNRVNRAVKSPERKGSLHE